MFITALDVGYLWWRWRGAVVATADVTLLAFTFGRLSTLPAGTYLDELNAAS